MRGARGGGGGGTSDPGHTKPRRQGEEGGIVKREAPLYASKVQVVCPKCGKGTRVAHKIADGKKSRVCKHCGAEL